MIYDNKINDSIKNIIHSELSDDVKIISEHSDHSKRMKKINKHEYLIEMDCDNFDENIWVHECMHMSQLEERYPQLITNIRSKSIRMLGERLQDFVLDTYLNNRLFNKYNYKITTLLYVDVDYSSIKNMSYSDYSSICETQASAEQAIYDTVYNNFS